VLARMDVGDPDALCEGDHPEWAHWTNESAAVLEAVGYADLDLLHQAAAIGAADSVLHLVAMQRTRAETAEAEVERLRRPFPCCSHCSADPGYHQENPRDSHDLPCTLCDDPIRTERDALLATLARVKVEGDRWANSKNYTSQFAGGLLREALRPSSDDDE